MASGFCQNPVTTLKSAGPASRSGLSKGLPRQLAHHGLRPEHALALAVGTSRSALRSLRVDNFGLRWTLTDSVPGP